MPLTDLYEMNSILLYRSLIKTSVMYMSYDNDKNAQYLKVNLSIQTETETVPCVHKS